MFDKYVAVLCIDTKIPKKSNRLTVAEIWICS